MKLVNNHNLKYIYGTKMEQTVKKKSLINALYRIISENTGDTLWMLDLETMLCTFISEKHNIGRGKYVETHDIIINSLGLFDETKSIKLSDFLTPESTKYLFERLNEDIERYKLKEIETISAVFEIQYYDTNGNIVWGDVSVTALTNNKGEVNKILGMVRNIDEQKRMELDIIEGANALKESEKKYRLIVENTKDIICVTDTPASKFLFVSGACLEILGYERSEFLKIPVRKTMPEKYYQKLSDLLETATAKFLAGQADQVELAMELQHYHKNGYLVWVEVSGKTIKDNDGNLSQMVMVIREIEDRKILEKELIENEKIFRLIAENTNDSIWVLNPTTFKYDYLSPATVHISGYTPDDILTMGRTFFEVLAEEYYIKKEQLEEDIQLFKDGKKDSIDIFFEAQIRHKDGSDVWIETSLSSMVDEQNKLIGIIGITRRIDERIEKDLKILEQQRKLEHANATKDKFFSIISHDIKNPFAALLSTSELLNDNYKIMNYQKIGNIVHLITKSTKYIYSLFEGLLEWSNSQTGIMLFMPHNNDLVRLVLETIPVLKHQSDAKNIDIDVITDNIKTAFFDRDMIRTVIRNLITNAIKFSPIDSLISVKIENYQKDDRYYIVSVTDKGVGISKEKIDRLFKIGEENISTKGTRSEMGTGLGLILCKEFVSKHKCVIFVESEIGKGSTFSFTVPKDNYNLIASDIDDSLLYDDNSIA